MQERARLSLLSGSHPFLLSLCCVTSAIVRRTLTSSTTHTHNKHSLPTTTSCSAEVNTHSLPTQTFLITGTLTSRSSNVNILHHIPSHLYHLRKAYCHFPNRYIARRTSVVAHTVVAVLIAGTTSRQHRLESVVATASPSGHLTTRTRYSSTPEHRR